MQSDDTFDTDAPGTPVDPDTRDASPCALIVVDGHHRIRGSNDVFDRDFRSLRPDASHPEHDAFGNAVGCINAVVEDQACGRTTRCPNCTLFQMVLRTIRDDVFVGPVTMQRTIYGGGAMPELRMVMSSRPFVHEGERLAALRIHTVPASPSA